MEGLGIVAAWLAGLCLVCALYAVWLESLKKRYEPDWTWATVAGGNALIGLALLGIELCGVPLTFWLVFLANVAAGIPIIAWQGWQVASRRARNGKGKGGEA